MTDAPRHPAGPRKKVALRNEVRGEDYRFLWAYLDEEENLHIDGQDLGPGTAIVSSDGEYEWFKTIAAVDIPLVVALLGGEPGEDVLDLLERRWSDERSYDLEARLRQSSIPIDLSVWRG